MEFGLKLMPIVSPNHFYSERELLDNVIDEIDGVALRVFIINLESSDSSTIVNSRILETPDAFALRVFEKQEFHIDLNMVSRHFLFITPKPCARTLFDVLRQAIELVSHKNSITAIMGDCDAMITLQVPANSMAPKMIRGSQMNNFLLDLPRDAQFMVFGTWFAINQSIFALLLISFFPRIKSLPAYPKISAGFGNVPNLLCVIKNLELP